MYYANNFTWDFCPLHFHKLENKALVSLSNLPMSQQINRRAKIQTQVRLQNPSLFYHTSAF